MPRVLKPLAPSLRKCLPLKESNQNFFTAARIGARLAGLDSSLRLNLDMALADGLDKNVIAGTNGLLGGTNLTAVTQGTRNTFALYRSSLVYARIDGTYASMASDLKMVVGPETYADMASRYPEQ